MPKRFEQILIATAIGLFLAIAVGIILRALFEIVVIFDLVGGDLTWGDIFTLMSIIAAGIIAVTGWCIARQNRLNEIERIAKAECAIFYRKYGRISDNAISILKHIFLDKNSVITCLNEHVAQPNDIHLPKHYARIKNMTKAYLPELPNTNDAHAPLTKVYQYSEKSGVLLSDTIVKMDQLIELLKHYGNTAEATSARRFIADRDMAIHHYYIFLNHLAAMPKYFEEIRRIFQKDSFEAPVRGEVLIELRQCFQKLYGIRFLDADPETNSDAYLEMFFKIKDTFGKVAKTSQDRLINKITTSDAAERE